MEMIDFKKGRNVIDKGPVKITAVLGSPSKNGSTCALAREVLRGARETGAETEEIFLAEKKIEFCQGCLSRDVKNMCMSTGRCNINDDVNSLKEILYNSDGIIFASPSYGMMPTARMKNFITDRIGMYTAYTSSLGDKYFVGISTAGGIGAKKVAKNLAYTFVNGFHQRGYMSGYIYAHVGYDTVKEQNFKLKEAYLLGKKLVKDVREKNRYPFQKIFPRFFNSIFVRKIILKNIIENKESRMKAVFEDLISRKLIKV